MDRDKRNSLWLSGQYVVLLLLSLVNLKLSLLTYGRNLFDLWLLFTSVWGVGSVLDFGFGVAIVTFVARSAKGKSDLSLSSIISTGCAVFVVLGIALVLAGIAAGEVFLFSDPHLIRHDDVPMVRIVFGLLGFNFLFQYFALFFRAVIEGMEDFVSTSAVSIASSVLVFLSVLLAYLFSLSLTWLALLYAFAALVQCAAFAVLVRRRTRGVRIALSEVKAATVRSMFGFSLAIQATYVLGALIDPVMKYVLRSYGASISVYEIARRFTVAISGLFASAFKNFLPKASILRNPVEYNAYLSTHAAEILNAGIRYSALCFGALSIVVVVVIQAVYGFDESVVLFSILALAEVVNITGYALYVFLVGIGKASVLILVQCLNLILYAGFLTIGYHYWNSPVGLLGCALSVLIGNAIMASAIARVAGVPIATFVTAQNVRRLAILLGLLLANCAVLLGTHFPVLAVESVFALVAGIVFWNDIVAASGIVYDSLRTRPTGGTS